MSQPISSMKTALINAFQGWSCPKKGTVTRIVVSFKEDSLKVLSCYLDHEADTKEVTGAQKLTLKQMFLKSFEKSLKEEHKFFIGITSCVIEINLLANEILISVDYEYAPENAPLSEVLENTLTQIY